MARLYKEKSLPVRTMKRGVWRSWSLLTRESVEQRGECGLVSWVVVSGKSGKIGVSNYTVKSSVLLGIIGRFGRFCS